MSRRGSLFCFLHLHNIYVILVLLVWFVVVIVSSTLLTRSAVIRSSVRVPVPVHERLAILMRRLRRHQVVQRRVILIVATVHEIGYVRVGVYLSRLEGAGSCVYCVPRWRFYGGSGGRCCGGGRKWVTSRSDGGLQDERGVRSEARQRTRQNGRRKGPPGSRGCC
jgi:hypothetical protein